MNYNHLTINDRLIIRKSLDIGFSIRQIARVLDISSSTACKTYADVVWQ